MFKNLIRSVFFALLAGTANAELFEVDNHELQQLLENNTTMIDVRRADEWQATGVVDSSHLFTFFDQYGRFDAEGWLSKLGQIANSEEPVILICQTGARSRVIGYWLSAKLGFNRVYNVSDGIESWKKAGNSVVEVSE